MPELSPRTLVLGWLLLLGGLLHAPARGVQADRAAQTIERFVTLAQAGELDADRAAMILLQGGALEARLVLQRLEKNPKARGPVIGRAINGVPGVANTLLSLPGLEGARALDVAEVALVVIEARGKDAGGLGAVELVLGRTAKHGGRDRLGKLARRIVKTAASKRELGTARFLTLLRAANKGVAIDLVRGAGDGLAGDVLLDTLGKEPAFDVALLGQLQRAVLRDCRFREHEPADRIQPYLTSEVEFERYHAVSILGELGARRHVEPLIERLDDRSALVRDAGLSSLRNLTGLAMGGGARRWTLWYHSQLDWWEDGGASVVTGLQTVRPEHLIETLATVASKQLYREEISTELCTMLERPDDDEVRAIIAALGALRDRKSVPALKRLRGHPSEPVRKSVTSALRQISPRKFASR